jgi:hypothetical protein
MFFSPLGQIFDLLERDLALQPNGPKESRVSVGSVHTRAVDKESRPGLRGYFWFLLAMASTWRQIEQN